MKVTAFIVIVGLIIGILAFLVHPVGSPSSSASPTPQASPEVSMQPQASAKQYKEAKEVIKSGKQYSAILHTTEGDITIALDTKNTPITANNFVFLSEEHFYDNTVFHRVISGFMIQGGDPTGTGSGGPGYQFADEKFSGSYTRGTVAMANAGKDTNGSQFFIMHADYPLPPNYVIFGHVTAGMEVVDKIATAPVKTSQTGENSVPVNPVHITSVDIKET